MGISALLQRTWQIVWGNRFMIGLGLLAGLGANALSGIPSIFTLPSMQNMMFEVNPAFSNIPSSQQEFMRQMMGGQMLFAICGFLVIGIPLWVLSRICVGGVIDATKTLGQGQPASFGASFRAGRARMNPMLGIGALASVPVMFLVTIQLVYSMGAMPAMFKAMMNANPRDPSAYMTQMIPYYGITTIISVIGGLIILPLLLWAVMAERACMLEGTGVIDSFRRAGSVLLDHAREAGLMVAALIGLGLVIGVIVTVLYGAIALVSMLLPCLAILFCLLLPVILVAQGLGYAFYHALWTLAWQQWVPAPTNPPEVAAPAV